MSLLAACVRKARRRCCRMVSSGGFVGRTSVNWRERLEQRPEVLGGKPVIKGSRLSVEFLLGLMAAGWEQPEILENYPGLTREDLLACLQYAQEVLETEQIIPLTA